MAGAMLNRTTPEKPITFACCTLACLTLCADLSFAQSGSGRANSASPSAPAPQSIPQSRGSENSASTGAGSGETGNLDASTVQSPNSISDEPNRLKRGGGASGKSLDECMADWDVGTHMTKKQWRTTCERLGR